MEPDVGLGRVLAAEALLGVGLVRGEGEERDGEEREEARARRGPARPARTFPLMTVGGVSHRTQGRVPAQ
jgi:hypothetical protein